MSKLEEMTKKVQELKEKKEKFLQSLEPKNFQSNYVACSECGSKIRKDLWQGIRCPACGKERISESARARLASMDSRIKKLQLEKMQLESKMRRKERKKQKKQKKTEAINGLLENAYALRNKATHDVGYTVYTDQGIMIPLQETNKSGWKKSSESFPTNGYYPCFRITHEEEEYGHDTHGWCANFEFCEPNDGRGITYDERYVCSKELSLEGALERCQSFMRENKSDIEKCIAFADSLK